MLQKLWKGKFKYYILIGLVFVIYMAFIDENNWMKQRSDKQKLQETIESIEYLNMQSDALEKEIRGLNNDPKVVEKHAREKYYHKADNEDVYIILDTSENK